MSQSRRLWATGLFREALPSVEAFRSPRAWAFCLLGLHAYCSVVPDNEFAMRLRISLADRLIAILVSVETESWVWFEEGLTYDNARLPQALLLTGMATGIPAYTKAALRSLRWLVAQQTGESGVFRPVGTQGFGDKRAAPRLFDQQPLEATATISACLAAWQVDCEPKWKVDALHAFSWFMGHNDLSLALVDLETGRLCPECGLYLWRLAPQGPDHPALCRLRYVFPFCNDKNSRASAGHDGLRSAGCGCFLPLAKNLGAGNHPAHRRDDQAAHHRLYQTEFDQPCLVRFGNRGADKTAAHAGQ